MKHNDGAVVDHEAEPSGVMGGEHAERARSIFELLETARSIEERLERALGEVGLSAPKYSALQALVRANEPLTLSELADQLSCVRSNITQLVDRLESDGLVRRVADPADRRVIRAVVTEVGAELHATGSATMERLQADLASRVDSADSALLNRVLLALK